jgi:hypothetical protein
MGFYIPEDDDILHSHSRENHKSYTNERRLTVNVYAQFAPGRWRVGRALNTISISADSVFHFKGAFFPTENLWRRMTIAGLCIMLRMHRRAVL